MALPVIETNLSGVVIGKPNFREHVIAPCQDDGQVHTTDYETKDAICICPLNKKGCLVDSRNHVISGEGVVIFRAQ